ncbi:hypothetical protein FEE95_02965 [Maribacter algarum]|uniref:Fibronectin type-III domain-containing protein n=1 Tax=Maribacter algarum (ex Zhang et al. 2020) TaxID=2578118 RepID=A0A5S3PU16_9FLAO|nr:hypothetical protein [Maribacter algarum]TMM58408.1 hypothetical protein FEE95_02965 [Maribacter algarum]
MNRIVKILTAVLTIGTLTSCPGGKDNPDDIDPSGAPSAATLVFPDNNMECTEGTVVSDSQSTILFQWEAAANANSYEVNITNLNTNSSSTVNTNTNEVSITVERNTPYSWFVVSKSDGTNATANSDSWRFYNQGEGVSNYAPFPASVVSPTRGQTLSSSGNVNLEWQGNDVDNDLVEFEVLFGTSNNPTTSLGVTAQSSIGASTNSGQTYYWRVISKDATGNTSQSEIFDFKVQ